MSFNNIVFLILILEIMRVGYCEDLLVVNKPPASEDQLRELASSVCSIWISESFDVCTENFYGSNRDSDLPEPSKITQWCLMKGSVNYTISPIRKWQIVALVPEDEEYLIQYKIIKTSSNDIIDYEWAGNATFWTSVFQDDGTSGLWLQGPEVPPWSDQTEHSCYATNVTIDIEAPAFAYINGTRYVEATFNWNFSSVPDGGTLEISNDCYIEGSLPIHTAKSVKADISTFSIPKLPLGKKCNISITFNGKTFRRGYDTPSCDDFPGCPPLPEKPEGIVLDAKRTNDDLGWIVEVKWDEPKHHKPEMYNVTLRAGGVYNDEVPGNATGVTFYNVKGEGRYNVSVDAILNGYTYYNVELDHFPERSEESSLAIVMAGTWCSLVVFAVMLVGIAVWWRRHPVRKLRFFYYQKPRSKLPEDCVSDCGVESVVEDGWEICSERLLLHEVIGEGAFGVVRRGTLAPGGKEVAVKMLKDFPTLEEIRSFRAEMELMKSVGAHPHIVSLVGCCSGRKPRIVVEYCSRGDLLSYLRCCWDVMVSKRNSKYYNNNLESSEYRNDLFKKQKQHSKLVVNKLYDLERMCDAELTSLDLLSFCRQIAMGMEFLASNRLVHRDLAARNILVTGDRTLKIADFGLSRDVYQENQYKQKGNGKMPLKWMALESLTHRIYTTQSDVWSFGVVMWEVVTIGGAPYAEVPAARLPRLLRAGYRMPRPQNCNKQLYDLMMSCWRARPRDRPTFSELHRKLDELLNSACADEYLCLELDGDDAPPTPKAQRYFRMILGKGNRVWTRGESYERPLKAPQNNYYTSTPAPQKPQGL